MTEPIHEALKRIAIETFEKLAFIFAFPADDASEPLGGDMVSAVVAFSGPFSGRVVIHISRSVLPELAGNMLGLDEEGGATPDQEFDALKETVNVVCGNLLPAIAGREPIFNMTMPEILYDDKTESVPVASSRLEFDEGECEVGVYIEGEMPEGVLIGD